MGIRRTTSHDSTSRVFTTSGTTRLNFPPLHHHDQQSTSHNSSSNSRRARAHVVLLLTSSGAHYLNPSPPHYPPNTTNKQFPIMIALRPILRTPLPTTPFTTTFRLPTIAPPHTRTATLLRRPKRPALKEQIVILSDGSAYKQLTTSPVGVIRSLKDSRNQPLWNPSMKELQNVEKDEAGKLKAFRDRFGGLYEIE